MGNFYKHNLISGVNDVSDHCNSKYEIKISEKCMYIHNE